MERLKRKFENLHLQNILIGEPRILTEVRQANNLSPSMNERTEIGDGMEASVGFETQIPAKYNPPAVDSIFEESEDTPPSTPIQPTPVPL